MTDVKNNGKTQSTVLSNHSSGLNDGTGAQSHTTLPGELAAQIARVSAVREMYREVQRISGPQVMCGPAIFMMTQSIDAAIKAAGSPDIVAQMRALKDLQEYGDD